MDITERAKAIVLTPKSEWRAIETEPGDPPYLFRSYVAILAAIPAVCGFLGMSIAGTHASALEPYRVSVLGALAAAVVRYILSFVMVYVIAMIADALAPTFGGSKSQSNALKLVVYAMTPIWLVGVFSLVPGLHVLKILGLYGLYIFWLGTPVLMKAPDEKSVPYAAAVVVCGIVVSLLIAAIVYAITWA
jgi:hypothetical protein